MMNSIADARRRAMNISHNVDGDTAEADQVFGKFFYDELNILLTKADEWRKTPADTPPKVPPTTEAIVSCAEAALTEVTAEVARVTRLYNQLAERRR
jgi:hypothetical protein